MALNNISKDYTQRFLLSLAATTVSIVLTFGTTAIIDRKKQKDEKREIVMMIMYDMRETLRKAEECDKDMKAFFDIQLDLIANPLKFEDSYIQLVSLLPAFEYSTTTENIFRSNIETINTIGNVLFVESVSSFYDKRSMYKTQVIDNFLTEGKQSADDYKSLTEFNSSIYPFNSQLYMMIMKRDFNQCMLMMKVSDKDLDVFSAERDKLLEATNANNINEDIKPIIEEKQQRDLKMEQALKAAAASKDF